MKKAILSHFLFVVFVFAGTAVTLSYYIMVSPDHESVLALSYQWSVIGYYAVIMALLAVCTLPLALHVSTRWLVRLLAWLWLVYLVIDIATFNLYQFHINLLLIEMFFLDFRGMGIPFQVLASFVGIGVLLVLLVATLGRFASKVSMRHGVISLTLVTLLGGLALAVHMVISIWAHYYAREEITRYDHYFPGYWRITADGEAPKISAAWPSVFPAQTGQGSVSGAAPRGIIRYPLKAPECKPLAQKPSILLLVIESWQASSLTAQIMPNLWEFSHSAVRFERHVSSGISTVYGLFGLLYGLHPTYYELMSASPLSHPSVFTETLHELGYRSRIFTAGDLERFSMHKMFFSKVSDTDFVEDPDDSVIVESYLASLENEQDEAEQQARFDFMFLTSSHSPYSYPPEFTRFTPLPEMKGGYVFNKMTDPLPYKNQYYNSLYYIDSLLGKLFSSLEWQRRLENTWVVITGDHAEEFNENGLGLWGHGSNFSRWQTQTPLVVYAPSRHLAAVESRLTLHQDIVPTLMQEVLGCTSPVSDYANGSSLFAPPEKRGTVITSYSDSAYLVNGNVIERTTGKKYAWDNAVEARSLTDTQAVREVIDEERQFMSE